jgi:hypothetical protein
MKHQFQEVQFYAKQQNIFPRFPVVRPTVILAFVFNKYCLKQIGQKQLTGNSHSVSFNSENIIKP